MTTTQTLGAIVLALAAAFSGCDSEQSNQQVTPADASTSVDGVHHKTHRERFSPVYSDEDVRYFLREDIRPYQAEKYIGYAGSLDNARAEHVVCLINDGISQRTAFEYFPRFQSSYLIRYLVEAGVSADIAKKYDKRFHALRIKELYKLKVLPDKANTYHKSFDDVSVLKLCMEQIPPEIANPFGLLNEKYGTRITGVRVMLLIEKKIPFEEIERKAKELWIEGLLK